MGVCGSKNESNGSLEAICPRDPDHLAIENQFASLLNIKNPNNLNHKYSHLYKVDENTFVGTGIKRTHAYISKVSMEEIKKKRLEFWGRTNSPRYPNRRDSSDLECSAFRLRKLRSRDHSDHVEGSKHQVAPQVTPDVLRQG